MADIASVSAASARPQNQVRQLLEPARANNQRIAGGGSAVERRDQVLKSVNTDVAAKQIKADAASGLASSEQFRGQLLAQNAVRSNNSPFQPIQGGGATQHDLLSSAANAGQPSTELASISAAVQARERTETLQKRDGVRADIQRLVDNRAAHVERQRSLITEDVELAAQRLQDRRNDLALQRDRNDVFRSQVRVLDTVAVDNRVQQIQRDITGDLNFARDTAESVNTQLLRNVESAQDQRQEIDTVRQRNQSFRQQQNDLEARVVARRAQDQSQAILQESNLRSSIARINEPQHAPDNAARGGLLDVSA